MNKQTNDIKDDEIRIISSERSIKKESHDKEENESRLPQSPQVSFSGLSNSSKDDSKGSSPKWKLWIILTAILFFGALCVFFWWEVKDDPEEDIPVFEIQTPGTESKETGFVETYDTIINKVPLTIFVPKDLTPKLYIGPEALKDSTARFVVQAADVRGDNGEILGAYVLDGNLLSKGQSKSGFCAIINGKPVIGVANSTPYLEQAIETGGYFFRQYPLVVGGQVVENKLKTSSLRKALAELKGEIVVVMNDKKQTLNEFSQTLVDLGVSNAIYLIGSTAPGFAIDKQGKRIDFGKEEENPMDKTNYIIWQ